MSQYKLIDKDIIPCEDLLEWATWLESADRIIAMDIENGIRISTVFLGLDHSLTGDIPLLFETMVFGGKYDGECKRYATYAEAEIGHRETIRDVFKQ